MLLNNKYYIDKTQPGKRLMGQKNKKTGIFTRSNIYAYWSVFNKMFRSKD